MAKSNRRKSFRTKKDMFSRTKKNLFSRLSLPKLLTNVSTRKSKKGGARKSKKSKKSRKSRK